MIVGRPFTATAAAVAIVLLLLLLSWRRPKDATSHLTSSSSSSSSSSVATAEAATAEIAASFSVKDTYAAQLVIVVSEGRSGSTELMDVVSNIYDARCISGKELFNTHHNGL